MPPDWKWDDEDIPPEEVLYRRVPQQPNCVYPDLLTGEQELKKGALRFDEDDGMSVHQESLRQALGVPKNLLCDWTTHHAVQFTANTVRLGGGGVVHEDDDDDLLLGAAHALVRTPSSSFPKPERDAIREAIFDDYCWVTEDPDCPARRR